MINKFYLMKKTLRSLDLGQNLHLWETYLGWFKSSTKLKIWRAFKLVASYNNQIVNFKRCNFRFQWAESPRINLSPVWTSIRVVEYGILNRGHRRSAARRRSGGETWFSWLHRHFCNTLSIPGKAFLGIKILNSLLFVKIVKCFLVGFRYEKIHFFKLILESCLRTLPYPFLHRRNFMGSYSQFNSFGDFVFTMCLELLSFENNALHET